MRAISWWLHVLILCMGSLRVSIEWCHHIAPRSSALGERGWSAGQVASSNQGSRVIREYVTAKISVSSLTGQRPPHRGAGRRRRGGEGGAAVGWWWPWCGTPPAGAVAALRVCSWPKSAPRCRRAACGDADGKHAITRGSVRARCSWSMLLNRARDGVTRVGLPHSAPAMRGRRAPPACSQPR
jgi:hypothetical protein